MYFSDKGYAISTDGRRLAFVPIPFGIESFTLPPNLLGDEASQNLAPKGKNNYPDNVLLMLDSIPEKNVAFTEADRTKFIKELLVSPASKLPKAKIMISTEEVIITHGLDRRYLDPICFPMIKDVAEQIRLETVILNTGLLKPLKMFKWSIIALGTALSFTSSDGSIFMVMPILQ